jgi:hypothetical protein
MDRCVLERRHPRSLMSRATTLRLSLALDLNLSPRLMESGVNQSQIDETGRRKGISVLKEWAAAKN